jgi:hypothetical protein
MVGPHLPQKVKHGEYKTSNYGSIKITLWSFTYVSNFIPWS